METERECKILRQKISDAIKSMNAKELLKLKAYLLNKKKEV